MTAEETCLIAGKLGITRKQFIQEYTDPRWPGTESYLLLHKNGACVFLQLSADKKHSLCRINDFKPACCRDWEPALYQPECREGLKSVWGLFVDSSGQISGTRDKVEAFENFIGSTEQPVIE